MNQHTLHRAMIADLNKLKRDPPAIFVDSLDVEYDRVLVANYFVDAVIETIDLADRRLASLEQMSRALADVLRDLLQLEREPTRSHPHVMQALAVLRDIDAILR